MKQADGEMKNWVLRLFAGSWSAMFAFAAWLLWRFFPDSLAWCWSLGVAMGLTVGLVCPTWMRLPYRLVDHLLAPVGRVFALFMLALVFFAVFTPFAVVLSLLRWDPLRRRAASRAGSGWVERTETAKTDYRWQY